MVLAHYELFSYALETPLALLVCSGDEISIEKKINSLSRGEANSVSLSVLSTA
jgi:hypothetical protein